MIALGGYIPGADREVDRAVEQAPQILQYLQQDDRQLSLYTQSLDELLSMPQGE